MEVSQRCAASFFVYGRRTWCDMHAFFPDCTKKSSLNRSPKKPLPNPLRREKGNKTASPQPSPKGEGGQLARYPVVFERTEWEKGASPQPSPKGEGG